MYSREASYNSSSANSNSSSSGSGSHSDGPLLTLPSSLHQQQMQQQQQVIGDITEPFWVQATTEAAVWGDPDDLCFSEAKRLVTAADRKTFWEMARAIMVGYIPLLQLIP